MTGILQRISRARSYLSRRQWPLRLHLAALVLSVVIPITIAFGWVVMSYAETERKMIDAITQAPVIDLAHTLNAELKGISTALQSMAVSEAIRRGDLVAFYDYAHSIPIPNGGWVVIKRLDGQILVHTLFPFGTELPSVTTQDGTDDLSRNRGKISISGVYHGRNSQQMVFTVGTAVNFQGYDHILKIAMPVKFLEDEIKKSVAAAKIPIGYNITVMDATGRIMARVPDHERFVGVMASERFREIVLSPGGPIQGTFFNPNNILGQPIMGSYYRIPSGWTVSVGIPYKEYWRSWNYAVTIIVIVGFVFIVSSIFISAGFANEIASAMQRLVTEADKLASDCEVESVRCYVVEVNRVAEALAKACKDLAERRRIKTLLIKEVDHRVKNSMATTLALARYSFQAGEDTKTGFKRFEGRLMAMAKTHDVLVGRRWGGAELGPLIAAETMPYGDRVELKGPEILVSPRMALSFSLGVHELAVNAVKYGSLSTPHGRVSITWFLVDREQEGSHRELHIVWQESGGPPVLEPKRRGFGSKLIKAAAQNEMTGTVAFSYHYEGFGCRIIVPLPDHDPEALRVSPWMQGPESGAIVVAPDPPAVSRSAL
jgi:two-component sensor histidine kinase